MSPGSVDRAADPLGARGFERLGDRGGVLDFEGDAHGPGDPPPDLDLIDRCRVRRVEQLERRPAGLEQCDAAVGLGPDLEQREPERVAVESERLVVVGDGEREAQLFHAHPAMLPPVPSAPLGSAHMAKAENPGVHATTSEKLEWLSELREEARHAGSEHSVARQRDAGQAARARTRRTALRSGLIRGARPVRPSSRVELRDARTAPVRRRSGDRLRDDLRPPGVRVQPGLHRLRRFAVGGVRREDLQGHGPRCKVRVPCDRHQRLRRRPDPGGRRVARRATPRSSGATSRRRA